MAKRLPLGFYSVQLKSTTWEVPDRYQDLKPLSSGAYGQVCSALDTQYNIRVAIKKLHSPFDHHHQAKKSYRELKILEHLKHTNCIGLLDVFTPSETPEEFSDFYMVMHLMSIDLAQLLKENKKSRQNILGEEHIKFFLYQILCGLKYVHSAGIIHRDLKPSNIAINPSCELRILDFGLARPSDSDMTGYVATRYYRAPEIVLNWKHYDKQVDIWSVGCIMAEMLGGFVLFPGDNQIDQLHRIFDIMGTPSKELIAKIPNEKTRMYLESLKPIAPKNIGNLLGAVDYNAVDLVKKLLVIDPESRITIDEALAHPYFAEYSDPEFESTAPLYNDDFEELELEAGSWKNLVWKEITNFTPDVNLYSELLENVQ